MWLTLPLMATLPKRWLPKTPNRGGAWIQGRYVPSLLAAIGSIIERHLAGLEAEPSLMPGARLRRPGPVRLLRLGFDLLPLVEAADRGAALPAPVAGESLVAVARTLLFNDLRVRAEALLDPAPQRRLRVEPDHRVLGHLAWKIARGNKFKRTA